MIKIVNGNIFTTGAKFISHQTNCVSKNSAGLARDIFERYPYADCYKIRNEIDSSSYNVPGTIQICGDGLEQRYIINIFGQYYPGKATPLSIDTVDARKKWFFNGLMEISKIPELNSIAFPYYIGCNLGGGDWEWYWSKLMKFSEYVKNKAVVLVYKLDN